MGPLFFRAENTYRSIADTTTIPLQWGRSFSERRTRNKSTKTAAGRRFNGAALFQSGEHTLRARLIPRTRCFNGAALFQSGERKEVALGHRQVQGLQWGRSFSERRTVHHLGDDDGEAQASMGPLFFRAENLRQPSGENAMRWLQWGRSFSERRTNRNAIIATFRANASMGPLFFRAENRSKPIARRSSRGFNGAALFQSGEPRPICSCGSCKTRFNGAALFQSGERHVWQADGHLAQGASMGPLFFRAENS